MARWFEVSMPKVQCHMFTDVLLGYAGVTGMRKSARPQDGKATARQYDSSVENHGFFFIANQDLFLPLNT